MPLDAKLLSRARKELENKKKTREAAYEQRVKRVYKICPRVRELDAALKETMLEVIAAAFKDGEDPEKTVGEIRRSNLELQAERRRELVRAGFNENYLDEGYMCDYCRDTGYHGTEPCECLMELYKLEQKASLSSLLKLGRETFDSFDLAFYPDTTDNEPGLSPRKSMEIVYETCVEYARKFGKGSMNLFFVGEPGLGKTFLSAAIARVVAENGFSVVYDTAASVFAKLEDNKFGRAEDPDAARDEVKRCLECDLLILDDLGTEMTTAFTTSALYELINTRLITGKKTIVSSNLSFPELRRRYSEQIMSRLEGEYQVLTFCGDDIRKLKKLV